MIRLLTKILICVAAVHVQVITGLVEPMTSLPPDLQEYLDMCHGNGDLSQQSAKLVFWTSINRYTSKFVKTRPDMTPQQTAYLNQNLRTALTPVFYYVNQAGRKKRQAQLPPARVRKEIRAMTVAERRTYFNALNAMKRSRALSPNVYDFLAAYHTGGNIGRAHFGPAFAAWHRVYLWIFEFFLRLFEPTATVPYWASVLDEDMFDPTESVLWSPGFFGNGVGQITEGPLRGWRQIDNAPVTRNIQGGELFTTEGIQQILSRTRNSEILMPTGPQDFNLEIQHGLAHTFVGGTMGGLNTAAQDPMFYSHHCFVDMIWERFRINQRRLGIDPESDIPFIANSERFRDTQGPNADTGFTGFNITQSVGFWNIFFELVVYEPIPSCQNLCGNSPYLYCNRTINRCVSRTRAEMRGTNYVDDLFDQPSSSPNSAPTSFMTQQAATSVTLPPDSSADVCPRRSFVNDVDTRRMSPPQGGNSWVYIPIKVVAKRPAEYDQFGEYSLYSQNIQSNLGLKDQFVRPGVQKKYENCDKLQGPVGKITVVSHGLNYEGSSEEYVIVDNRLGVAEGSGYIPVKNPSGSVPTEAIIAAFDSCGRICRPYCKQGASGGMASENDFSGGIRVSRRTPLQYANSYAEAMLNVWEVPSPTSCPSVNYNHVPVSFFCDYTDRWIWNSTNMRSGMASSGIMTSQIGNQHVPSHGSLGSSPQHIGSVDPVHTADTNRQGSGGRRNGGRRNRPGRPRGNNRPAHRPGVPFRGPSSMDHLIPDRYEGRRRT